MYQRADEQSSLLAIPLYHFLTGTSKPNQSSFADNDHQNDLWWGIGREMKTYIQNYKSKNTAIMLVKVFILVLSTSW
jgi:hypothetical protein